MHTPRISIGMPVFNSRPEYFRAALASLLAQSFTDFELLISDNGSDPKHAAMYLAAARTDPRIRYVRHPFNQGPTFNFTYCVSASRGEYFCWAADDDLRHPDFLQDCVTLLDLQPQSVLAGARMVEIDPAGRPLRHVRHDVRLGSPNVVERVQALRNMRYVYDIYGVFRRAHLAKSAIVREAFARNFWGADNVVVFSAILAGPVLRTRRTLFHYRVKPEDTCLTRHFTGPGQQDDPAPVIRAERERTRHLALAVWWSVLSAAVKVRVFAALLLIVNRSPYTNERKFMARHHFRKAVREQRWRRAAQMAVRYWRLSPLAPLRPAAWKAVPRQASA
mgnify:CR=1 FL=1